MSPENFVYWLQGFMELSKAQTMTADQVKEINEHLAKVLFHTSAPLMPQYIHPLDTKNSPSYDGPKFIC